MTTQRRHGVTEGSRLNAAGFSLVEVMVAIVIASFLAGALYAYNAYERKQFLQQRNLNDLQGNGRFILDSLGRDIQMAGYHPINLPGIVEASANKLVIEYTDDKATSPPPYLNNRRVTYYRDTTDTVHTPVKRKVEMWNPTSINVDKYEAAQESVIGEYVQSLNFTYYDSTNTLMTAPGTFNGTTTVCTPAAVYCTSEVRAIQVTFQVRSFDKDPAVVNGGYKTLTLAGSWQPRNLGIASNPTDTTPPATPTGLKARDPGDCGRLLVQWDANTEDDLGGYILYIGQEPGTYTNMAKIPSPSQTTHTFSGLVNNTTYYIAISAYDNSLNKSRLSTEVYGLPIPSQRDFATGTTDDTTLNAITPLPPGGFDATVGGANGRVDLVWTVSATPGISGYRLFRSTTAGFVPSGSAAGTGNCIVDEGTLSAATVSFQDNGLLGCATYYYAIASIGCDAALAATYVTADYSFAYGDGAKTTITDSPRNGFTNTTPTDTGLPSSPIISSMAGWKRTFVSLTNPDRSAEPDFTFSKIYFSRAGYPTIDANCALNAGTGTLVPTNSGVFPNSGSSGNNFIHDSETRPSPPSPELIADSTYYYLAVAYDKCNNCSSVTDQSKTLSVLCGDDPAGLPLGGEAMALHVTGCGTSPRITWDEGTLKSVPDFAGYHLYRDTNPTFRGAPPGIELTGGVPQWSNTFLDTTVVAGNTYSYAVKYTDCAYENANGGNISTPHVLNGLSFGTLDLAPSQPILSGDLTVSPITKTNYEHNKVRFFIRNTSAAPMTLSGLTISWNNPLAYLRKIFIGGSPATTPNTPSPVWQDNGATLTRSSGGTVYFSKVINASDVQVPVTLEFADPNKNVNYNIDMRGKWVVLTTRFNNQTTGSNCAYSSVIWVPAGPTIANTTQDRPYAAQPSWMMPGTGGTNVNNQMVVVPGGVPVSVSTHVTSGVAMDSVTLYYWVENANTLKVGPDYDGSNYTALPMRFVSGDLWTADDTTGFSAIPAQSVATSVWYFIVAKDSVGNFVRDPANQGGNYQYMQQNLSFCGNTPVAPELSGTPLGSAVKLDWFQPLFNDDGSILADLQGFSIYRWDGATSSLITTIANPATTTSTDTFAQKAGTLSADMGAAANAMTVTGTDVFAGSGRLLIDDEVLSYASMSSTTGTGSPPPVTTTFSGVIRGLIGTTAAAHGANGTVKQSDLITNDFTYYMTSYDKCTPTANTSYPASNGWSECIGAASCGYLTATATSINAGDSFGLTLYVCARSNNGISDEVLWLNDCTQGTITSLDADPIRLKEVHDTGYFVIDQTFYQGRNLVKTYTAANYALLTSPVNLDLKVNENSDVVKISGYALGSAPSAWDSYCATDGFSCETKPINIAVIPNYCAVTQTAPTNAPTGLTATGNSCSSTPSVSLSWTGATLAGGTITNYRVFRCNSGSTCSPTTQIADLPSTQTTYTDTPALSANTRYAVKAVNELCSTQIKEGPASSTVAAPCTFTLTASASPDAGGTISPSGNVSANAGASQSFSYTVNSGYYFAGWSVDGAAAVTTPVPYVFSNIAANHTIVATFAPAFTIAASVSPVGGGTINPSGNVTVNSGASQTFNSFNPSAGYAFWNLTVDGATVSGVTSYTFTNVIANGHTIVANFLPTYKITTSAGANGTIDPTFSAMQGANATVNFTPNSGYRVSSITIDGGASQPWSSNSYTFMNVNATHSISVAFTRIWTITVTAGANGTVSPMGTGGIVTVDNGTNQTFTITANTGYRSSVVVDGGAAQSSLTSYTFSNVTTTHTINVTFIQTRRITVTAGANGTVSPMGTGGIVTVDNGTNQAFIITANAGYRSSVVVNGGAAQPNLTGYTFSNVTTDTNTISVTFVKIWNITLTVGANGSIAPPGTAGIVAVDNGTDQTFTFNPNTGYLVSTVTVDGVAQAGPPTSSTFTNVTAVHTVNVTFVIQQFTITPSAGAGGTISPAVATVINYGSSLGFTITANANYEVSSVLVDGAAQTLPPLSYSYTYTFSNVTANHTISATFGANLSIGKTATASSTNGTNVAGNAIDGSIATIWRSGAAGTQWLRVDLGSSQPISSIILKWGTVYATAFNIQTSIDGTSWTQRYSVSGGNGADIETTFATANARYVIVNMTTSSGSNYRVEELEVYP